MEGWVKELFRNMFTEVITQMWSGLVLLKPYIQMEG